MKKMLEKPFLKKKIVLFFPFLKKELSWNQPWPQIIFCKLYFVSPKLLSSYILFRWIGIGQDRDWKGFPGGTSGGELTCQCRRQKGHGFSPWVGKIPWRRQWQLTPVFLPGESHGQRSLAGYTVHRVAKSRTRLKQLNVHTQRLETEFIPSQRFTELNYG